ncbi:hypothetical protein HPB49_004751 [Dermacentor silvarum]|uniref:Uncharacterized protein n=1 Tax=Dermacentor silvarum TaxID=543639 RepID=A0ACB8CJL0_DERSI|nr:hypothetical protein HPB49_004751 [Dermacentor silvarum]
MSEQSSNHTKVSDEPVVEKAALNEPVDEDLDNLLDSALQDFEKPTPTHDNDAAKSQVRQDGNLAEPLVGDERQHPWTAEFGQFADVMQGLLQEDPQLQEQFSRIAQSANRAASAASDEEFSATLNETLRNISDTALAFGGRKEWTQFQKSTVEARRWLKHIPTCHRKSRLSSAYLHCWFYNGSGLTLQERPQGVAVIDSVSIACTVNMAASFCGQDPPTEDELSRLVGSLGLEGGPNGGGGDVPGLVSMMQGMMQNLLSKDLLYPALRDIVDKYPDWLADKRPSLADEEYERYNRQFGLMRQVCEEFEAELSSDAAEVKQARFERVLSLMQKMQECGHPPKELVEIVSATFSWLWWHLEMSLEGERLTFTALCRVNARAVSHIK